MRKRLHPLKSSFKVELPVAATVLDCFIESFRGRKELVTLFTAAANGNTRDMLKYVYQLLTSKFLDTREIAQKYTAAKTYKVPVHHAVRALLYGDFLHYDPKTCMFINLFDIQQADPLEHFTRLTALNYLSTVSESHPAYGFAKVTEVVSYLIKVGYSSSHAIWTLTYLFDRKCIESRDPVEEWTDDVREIRITDLGSYHINELLANFVYFDAVTVDTPILDSAKRQLIHDVYPIRKRIERCHVFLEYLDKASGSVLDVTVRQYWSDLHGKVLESMKRIQDRIDELENEY